MPTTPAPDSLLPTPQRAAPWLVVGLFLWLTLLCWWGCNPTTSALDGTATEPTADASRSEAGLPDQAHESTPEPGDKLGDKPADTSAPERAKGTPEALEATREASAEVAPETIVELPPAPKPLLTKAQQDRVNAFVDAEMKRQGLVGLAIGVVVQGKLAYAKGYGWADQEKKIPVVAQQTMFRWASISKTLVGVVALQLNEQKKLDLDRPLQDYYKAYKTPTSFVEKCTGGSKVYQGTTYPCDGGYFTMPLGTSQQVTSRMLLGHLGGISHYTNGKGSPSPPSSATNDPKQNTGTKWTMQYLLPKPLVAVPGDKYSYTTFGFNLLGVVLEEATGKRLADLVDVGISRLAGTKHLQPDYEWRTIPHRATGYYKLGTTPLPQKSSDVSWKLGGGGFISTVVDLAMYCRALTDETLLSPTAKQLAWTPQKPKTGRSSYGMGFGIGSRNGRPTVSHTGSQQKARTHLRLYPQERFCITVMSNSTYASTSPIVSGIEDAVRKGP